MHRRQKKLIWKAQCVLLVRMWISRLCLVSHRKQISGAGTWQRSMASSTSMTSQTDLISEPTLTTKESAILLWPKKDIACQVWQYFCRVHSKLRTQFFRAVASRHRTCSIHDNFHKALTPDRLTACKQPEESRRQAFQSEYLQNETYKLGLTSQVKCCLEQTPTHAMLEHLDSLLLELATLMLADRKSVV